MEAFQSRKTWAEINLEAIGHNISQMKQKLPAATNIMAVVKADGYGHGSVPVAKAAIKAGVSALAVALLEEAIVLRQASIDVPILVLGWVAPEDAPVAAAYNITLTAFQTEWLERVETLQMDGTVRIHMKLDTGMGRIGMRHEQEIQSFFAVLKDCPHIQLTGVFTHFATADAADLMYFHQQEKCFEQMLAYVRRNWSTPLTVHVGNSAASIRFPEQMHNYIRFGISMYGLYPSKYVKAEKQIDLQPAFSLHSRLVHVKKVAAGSSISYGGTYIAKQDEWIGTIPIGYGDGWQRRMQGFEVLVSGKRMPIVGRVCMDQTMIKLDQPYEIGTKVTLIGRQNNACIEMDEVADYLGTINYEVPCLISKRVPRIYV
ncbi:alanine racemase [Virgibacillus sp. 179-BFC.A HS]|uniref:Alanine racemase n=1 Tax=Tigheibacillus jepli TaxID=3035914 RepID=A0ABU5CKQ6_9BACI|nr:alanine racemase [Virgibacillus sp. 179-BFC.A HS]MDY0406899.1 alanine racemase [Virgibacillus sp. 179-BFC.A HS]